MNKLDFKEALNSADAHDIFKKVIRELLEEEEAYKLLRLRFPNLPDYTEISKLKLDKLKRGT